MCECDVCVINDGSSFQPIKEVVWHAKGDYFATLMVDGKLAGREGGREGGGARRFFSSFPPSLSPSSLRLLLPPPPPLPPLPPPLSPSFPHRDQYCSPHPPVN